MSSARPIVGRDAELQQLEAIVAALDAGSCGVVAIDEVFPIELARAMFIGMDPPKHDRLKALFQAGFTPKRIAAHEEAIRAIAHEEVTLHAAGRTDAGVHALAMTAHVDIERRIGAHRLADGTNAKLRPLPVAILAADVG